MTTESSPTVSVCATAFYTGKTYRANVHLRRLSVTRRPSGEIHVAFHGGHQREYAWLQLPVALLHAWLDPL